jgi:hypothetical protein
LSKNGYLPPPPKRLEEYLDNVEISIDPHVSIQKIPKEIEYMGNLLNKIGISILHNVMDITFITSDNPLIFFDPTVSETNMQPYKLKKAGAIVLLFPITPKLLLFGHSATLQTFKETGIEHKKISDNHEIKRINRHVCRFAYKNIFTQNKEHERLIKKYASISPIFTGKSDKMFKFGSREKKSKWKNKCME